MGRGGYWQAPPTQVRPLAQDDPQAPQFWALVVKSTQLPEQSLAPSGQAHRPSEHTRFPPQEAWQKPQLALSVFRSTHFPLQRASPDGQAAAQAPSTQTWPPVQRLAHAPQFWASACRSTQETPPPGPGPPCCWHSLNPLAQPQVPPEQICWPEHALPQPPQLRASESGFTHELLHRIRPVAQAVTALHWPARHTGWGRR